MFAYSSPTFRQKRNDEQLCPFKIVGWTTVLYSKSTNSLLFFFRTAFFKERETQLTEHVSRRRSLRLFYRVSARLSLFPKNSNRGSSFHRCGELFQLYVTSQTTKSQMVPYLVPFTLPLCVPSVPSPLKEKGGWVGKNATCWSPRLINLLFTYCVVRLFHAV